MRVTNLHEMQKGRNKTKQAKKNNALTANSQRIVLRYMSRIGLVRILSMAVYHGLPDLRNKNDQWENHEE